MADTAPFQTKVSIPIAPQLAGASATIAATIAMFPGFVAGVKYIPNAAVVGAASPNNRTISVMNVGPGAVAGSANNPPLGQLAAVTLDGTNNVAAYAALNVPVNTPPNYTPKVDPSFNYVNENPNTGQTGSNTFTPPVIALTANSFQTGDVIQVRTTANGTGVADPGGEIIIILERAGNV